MKKIALLCCIIILSTVNGFSQKLTSDEMIVFNEVAFALSLKKDKTELVKWNSPIVYMVKGKTEPYVLEMIDVTFEELKKLIPISIQKTTDSTVANFVFKIGTKADQPVMSSGASKFIFYSGSFNHKVNDKFEIFNVQRLLMVDNYPTKVAVKEDIIRTIMRGLGFLSKTDYAEFSVFFHKSNSKLKIDKFDSHIIQAFYSSKIKPGTTKTDVNYILNEL